MEKLDFLFLEPSLDIDKDIQIKVDMRVEKDRPSREGAKLSVGYVLAVLKKNGYKAKFISMVHERMTIDDILVYINNNNPSLIGMSAFTFQIPIIGKMCEIIKRHFPSIPICVGGCHATAIPDKTLSEYQSIDFIVLGEAEDIICQVVDNSHSISSLSNIKGIVTREGRGILPGHKTYIDDVDKIPFPAWEEFDLKKFPGDLNYISNRELPIISGRGCPFRCVFCCRHLGDFCRRRSVDNVISEMRRNLECFGSDGVAFEDETFVLNKMWISDFFKKMDDTGLNKRMKWYCSTRVSSVTPDLLKEMKRAGCYALFYGFESSHNKTLNLIKKNITREQMKNAVQCAKEAGIVPIGAFIVGLPGETEKDIIETIDFGTQLELYSITFPIATPFPGTELRDMALRHEYGMRINHDDWSCYIANDFDKYGKVEARVLESEDLPWEKRIELQKIGYSKNPKKKFLEYIKTIPF